jgi:hypothetical protein
MFVMRKLRLIILITGILVAGIVASGFAQTKRSSRTSGARAYYGQTPGKPKLKGKNQKRDKSKVVKAPKMKSRVQAKDGYVRRRGIS